MSPLRIAVAGAGLMGRSHAQLLADHAQTRLSAFVDPAEHGQAMAREFGENYDTVCEVRLTPAKSIAQQQMDCIDVPAAQRHSKTLVFLHGLARAYIYI